MEHRVRRLPVLILTVLTCIALLVSILEWCRSYSHSDALCFTSESSYYECFAYKGELIVARIERYRDEPPSPIFGTRIGSDAGNFYGFTVLYTRNQHGSLVKFNSNPNVPKTEGGLTHWALCVPLWLIVIFASLLPGIQVIAKLRRHFSRRQSSKDRCLNCSYDLRAHKRGDKCPECGTVISFGSLS